MIHFKQNVEMDTNQSIFIYNGNGTLFEEIKLNSDNVIDVQSKRIMFKAGNNFVIDSNYYINFSENVFSDSTTILDDSTWSFTCGLKLLDEQLFCKAIDDSFRLMIGLPKGYSTDVDSSYPVVYITDGGFFNHGQYSAIANAGAFDEAKDYILVGITYPRKYTINDIRQFRRRDLATSPLNLLNFLNDTIIPFVDSNYRTKPQENTLIGNSNGGYFATYTLTSYREDKKFHFKNIFAVAQLDAFASRESAMALEITDLPVNFYLAVGGDDNSSRISAFNRLKDSLICRQYPSFGFEFKVYDGMPHGEVSATAAFYDAFRLTDFTKLWPCDLPQPNSIDMNKTNSLKGNVYPNPTSDLLYVDIQNDNLNDVTLCLYNSIGKIIYSDILNDNKYTLNVNQFSKGYYLLVIKCKDDTITEKVIIE
jgi:predicted alpha/beta superfamily hydrolase